MLTADDDWRRVTDIQERRKIQNRLAQRNYRLKLKRRLHELERRAGSEEVTVPTTAASRKRACQQQQPKNKRQQQTRQPKQQPEIQIDQYFDQQTPFYMPVPAAPLASRGIRRGTPPLITTFSDDWSYPSYPDSSEPCSATTASDCSPPITPTAEETTQLIFLSEEYAQGTPSLVTPNNFQDCHWDKQIYPQPTNGQFLEYSLVTSPVEGVRPMLPYSPTDAIYPPSAFPQFPVRYTTAPLVTPSQYVNTIETYECQFSIPVRNPVTVSMAPERIEQTFIGIPTSTFEESGPWSSIPEEMHTLRPACTQMAMPSQFAYEAVPVPGFSYAASNQSQNWEQWNTQSSNWDFSR
jgi:hypothetical protein